MVFVDRDWINPKVTNDMSLVIYYALMFAIDMTGWSLLVEAYKDKLSDVGPPKNCRIIVPR